jgi:hypothetical protein
MRYLSEDEVMQMQGLGDVGDLYEGLDGHLYEWVEGVDAWGESIGVWQGVSEPETPVLGGLGALYEAPDGRLYQVQGLSAEEEEAAEAEEAPAQSEAPAESEEASETPAMPAMGRGRPGEIRRGPDGKRYRWVQGRDAQGKRTAFWRRLRPRVSAQRRPPRLRPRPGARPGRPRPGVKGRTRRKGGFLRKLLPVAKLATRLIPFPGAGALVRGGLTVAGKLLKKPGVAGYAGLGALYQAPDGTLYRMQGLAEEDLDGLYADEELRGFAEDEELRGFAEDEELRGLDEDEELRGLEQEYVRDDAVSGLEAYVPEEPPQTRWFASSPEPPEIWKPLW